MSKAILVMDMPKGCDDCPLMCWVNEGTEIYPKTWIGCWLNKRKTHGKKPKWCPLEEVPKKIKMERDKFNPYGEDYSFGWNDCLKEILGDEDE